MKKLTNGLLLGGLLMIIGITNVMAQDITDEDIKNYAIIELAKNSITGGISPMVNELISKQEGMTGQRFQELQKAGEDQSKLDAIEAQDWEVKFLGLVNRQINKRKKAAGEVVTLLAGNAMGAEKYNAVKKAVKDDPAVKSKLDAMIAKFE